MNPEALFNNISDFLSQQPLDKVLLYLVGAPLSLGLIILVTKVMNKAILGNKSAPFIRLVEMFSLLVTILVAWINYRENKSSYVFWSLIVIIGILGAYGSWQILKHAEEKDRQQNK